MRFKTSVVIRWALICMLCAALGFCAAFYFCQPVSSNAAVEDSEAFSRQVLTVQQFRTERQQLRSMQKGQINDIIFGGMADADTVADAQAQLLAILKREDQENTLEGLLEMRGFRDVIVSIHRDSASILVAKDVVTRQESAVILDLVCRETGFLGGNIKIIPINLDN